MTSIVMDKPEEISSSHLFLDSFSLVNVNVNFYKKSDSKCSITILFSK